MFATTNILPIHPVRSLRDRLRTYFAAAERLSLEKRSIRQLQQLDDRMLRDIGVTPEEVQRMKPRPFHHFV